MFEGTCSVLKYSHSLTENNDDIGPVERESGEPIYKLKGAAGERGRGSRRRGGVYETSGGTKNRNLVVRAKIRPPVCLITELSPEEKRISDLGGARVD